MYIYFLCYFISFYFCFRHSPSPVPSTGLKAVRFSDGGGGGGVGGANKEATCSSTNDDSNVRDERATVRD